MLEISDLSVSYGGIRALRGISLRVSQGDIVTLIGANGAGKSTTLRAISGLVEARQGKILFRQREIQNRPAHRIVQEGIALVPEGRRIFVNLSVEENLLMGAYARKDREEIRQRMEWVFHHFPRLKERPRQKGGTLSGGEQQMLALGRGLMSHPDLLMLDEPSLGLAPKLVNEVFDMIQNIHADGTTILLIEQNATAALEVAAHGYVLQTGKITTEGKGKDLIKDPAVKEAYLGEGLK
ncbi:MAG TPA: ABC transporter ATP-binding protein [Thermodesulfobacteriota bacterium]|nr:ABC transporter ATP-binding protein [Thermodesulfobacteriota bacterium]